LACGIIPGVGDAPVMSAAWSPMAQWDALKKAMTVIPAQQRSRRRKIY
jgi:hypothetical protein